MQSHTRLVYIVRGVPEKSGGNKNNTFWTEINRKDKTIKEKSTAVMPVISDALKTLGFGKI